MRTLRESRSGRYGSMVHVWSKALVLHCVRYEVTILPGREADTAKFEYRGCPLFRNGRAA